MKLKVRRLDTVLQRRNWSWIALLSNKTASGLQIFVVLFVGVKPSSSMTDPNILSGDSLRLPKWSPVSIYDIVSPCLGAHWLSHLARFGCAILAWQAAHIKPHSLDILLVHILKRHIPFDLLSVPWIATGFWTLHCI